MNILFLNMDYKLLRHLYTNWHEALTERFCQTECCIDFITSFPKTDILDKLRHPKLFESFPIWSDKNID